MGIGSQLNVPFRFRETLAVLDAHYRSAIEDVGAHRLATVAVGAGNLKSSRQKEGPAFVVGSVDNAGKGNAEGADAVNVGISDVVKSRSTGVEDGRVVMVPTGIGRVTAVAATIVAAVIVTGVVRSRMIVTTVIVVMIMAVVTGVIVPRMIIVLGVIVAGVVLTRMVVIVLCPEGGS